MLDFVVVDGAVRLHLESHGSTVPVVHDEVDLVIPFARAQMRHCGLSGLRVGAQTQRDEGFE